MLLDSGVSVNLLDHDGYSALRWASGKGQLKVVRFLLDHGAQIDKPDKTNCTPLYDAAANGRLETVRLLLDRGAAIEHLNEYGDTALLRAARSSRSPKTLRLLLYRGAAIHHSNYDGDTALLSAINSGHKKVIKIIEDELEEHRTYEERKQTIEYTFRLFSEKRIPSEETSPEVNIPKVLVNIIDDYLRPVGIAANRV